MGMDRDRDRLLVNQAASADQQPWRCAKCNKAVRPGYGDPCDCYEPDSVRTRQEPENELES